MALKDLDDRPAVERGFEDDLLVAIKALRERLDGIGRAADAEVSARLAVFVESADLEGLLVDLEAVAPAESLGGG